MNIIFCNIVETVTGHQCEGYQWNKQSKMEKWPLSIIKK